MSSFPTPSLDYPSPLPLPLPPATLDTPTIHSPSPSDSEPLADSDSTGGLNASALLDVDPQIIEALKSKDRIYVLKLGERMESLINDHRFVFSVLFSLTPTSTAFPRFTDDFNSSGLASI